MSRFSCGLYKIGSNKPVVYEIYAVIFMISSGNASMIQMHLGMVVCENTAEEHNIQSIYNCIENSKLQRRVAPKLYPFVFLS